MDKKESRKFSKESNISYADYCLNCGHNHIPANWHAKARFCTVAAVDNEECSCTPARFVGRSFKGKFA